MRFLGIDYGSKRIGLALSDAEGKIAFPQEIIVNDGKVLNKLSKILKEKEVHAIVIGESINSQGLPNPIAQAIESFAETLGHSFQIPVHKEKEFFTSVEARRLKEGESRVDSSAAALILQRYLDKISK